jgi:hypothetical protein
VFFLLFTIPFLVRDLGVLPAPAVLIIELLGAGVGLLGLIGLGQYQRLPWSRGYIYLALVALLAVVSGAILNAVLPGTLLSGVRTFFRFAPFFLMPLIVQWSPRTLRWQLYTLGFLALVQLPVTLVQQFVLDLPPDRVSGTVAISSVLSMYLIGTLCFVFAKYLYGSLGAVSTAIAALLLFIPTTLNETKGTLILLPIAITTIVLASGSIRRNPTRVLGSVSAVFGLLLTFGLVYNAIFPERAAGGALLGFFIGDDQGQDAVSYLYSGDEILVDVERLIGGSGEHVVGERSPLAGAEGRVRRFDSIVLPIRTLSDDFPTLFLGLGAGNVSGSTIASFSGPYAGIRALTPAQPGITGILWELGLLGAAVFIVFPLLVMRDAWLLARSETPLKVFGAAWAGICAMVLLAFAYKNVLDFQVLAVMFMYWSGFVATQAHQVRLQRA